MGYFLEKCFDNADFYEAKLLKTEFVGTGLDQAQFSGAKLSGSSEYMPIPQCRNHNREFARLYHRSRPSAWFCLFGRSCR